MKDEGELTTYGLSEYLVDVVPLNTDKLFYRKYCTSPHCDPETKVKGVLKFNLSRDTIECPDCAYSLYTEFYKE